MTEAEFSHLSSCIREQTGIHLTSSRKSLLEGRLQKRLKARGMSSFGDYCSLLSGPLGESEKTSFLDLVTTNKTDFFREPAHFTFLETCLLPELAARNGEEQIRCWSAGCSSGEEPYTLAMVLSEYAGRHRGYTGQYQLPDFQIYATDLCTSVLETAQRAVYPENRIGDIPAAFRQKYLLRSKDKASPTVRIGSALRSKVRFSRLNFVDRQYCVPEDFHFIFCRNVLIYFEKPLQQEVIRKLCNHLQRGGYLFLGHSESITGMDLPLRQVRPSVYVRL